MDRLGGLILALALAPSVVQAQCRIAGCVSPPERQVADRAPGPVAIGAILPRSEHETIWATEHYGLPRPDATWVYMRVDDDLYRVDWRSMEVLEHVTHLMRRSFPDVLAERRVVPRVVDRTGTD